MTDSRELQAERAKLKGPGRAKNKPNSIRVRLTVPQAQALVEAGEEWPDFADMSGTQIRASKRGAKEIRSALLGIGRGPTWK